VLVALSIDRYDAITHPMNFSGSWRRAKVLVAAAWILSGRPSYTLSGINFTNIQCEDFLREDPKSTKKTDSLTVFFELLGSVRVYVGVIDPRYPLSLDI